MKHPKGFSLIELLIVVAIILIIAAIAIPMLLRARIAANESGMVGDIRTVISAQATFNAAAGGFGDLTCLYPNPELCAVGAGTIPLIDSVIADTTITKSGYRRLESNDGNLVMSPVVILNVWQQMCYGGTPATQGRTGIKNFAGAMDGILSQDITGTIDCCVAGVNNFAGGCISMAQ